MSVLTSAPTSGLPELKVTQLRVLRSEWTKFRSLRSTMWTLLTALVLMIVAIILTPGLGMLALLEIPVALLVIGSVVAERRYRKRRSEGAGSREGSCRRYF